MIFRRRRFAVLTTLAILASSAPAAIAWADSGEPDTTAPSEEQQAEALKLFNDGRAKMQDAKKINEACDILTESYKLHHRGDTLLNLAECHRRQGKTATAWREFDEAIRYAKQFEFTEAIDTAASLRDELAKHLSQLVVTVPTAPDGLSVILDGKPLPKAQWDQRLFVDPGVHEVTASADGYKPFDQSTEVKSGSDRATITVALDKIPPPPPPPPPPKPVPKPPPPPKHGTVPTWSYIVGGAGIVMLGVSTGFGVDEVIVGNRLDQKCGAERKACPPSYDFHGDRTRELRSYGLFVGFGVAGIAATATGVIGAILGVTSTKKSDVAIAPWASPQSGGLSVAGSF